MGGGTASGSACVVNTAMPVALLRHSYNVKRSDLDKAVLITPGHESPTIQELNDDGWVRIRMPTSPLPECKGHAN